VLGIEPGPIDQVVRARVPQRLPVVLTHDEVGSVLKQLDGRLWLMVALLYGAGLRLRECLELRVKDVDFGQNQVVVRRGKGQKDRYTVLPAVVKEPLTAHLEEVRKTHTRDLARGLGRVTLPFALERKYPNAATDWVWQFVFPAGRVCRDPLWGAPSRYHTMIYTHVLNRGGLGVRSPADRLSCLPLRGSTRT
jgi:integrase